MNDEIISLDTNILIYSLDKQAGKKHEIAKNLIKSIAFSNMECILTLQSLTEFYFAVTRKKIANQKLANEQIADWAEIFPVVSAQPSTLLYVMREHTKHNLSFWDAMLWATAQQAGVSLLFSEDYQHKKCVKSVQFFNPFAEDFII